MNGYLEAMTIITLELQSLASMEKTSGGDIIAAQVHILEKVKSKLEVLFDNELAAISKEFETKGESNE